MIRKYGENSEEMKSYVLQRHLGSQDCSLSTLTICFLTN